MHVRVVVRLHMTMDDVVAGTLHEISIVIQSLTMAFLSFMNCHGLLMIELQVRFLVAAFASILKNLVVVRSDWLTSFVRDCVHLDFMIQVLFFLLLMIRFLFWFRRR